MRYKIVFGRLPKSFLNIIFDSSRVEIFYQNSVYRSFLAWAYNCNEISRNELDLAVRQKINVNFILKTEFYFTYRFF